MDLRNHCEDFSGFAEILAKYKFEAQNLQTNKGTAVPETDRISHMINLENRDDSLKRQGFTRGDVMSATDGIWPLCPSAG